MKILRNDIWIKLHKGTIMHGQSTHNTIYFQLRMMNQLLFFCGFADRASQYIYRFADRASKYIYRFADRASQ